MRSSEPLYVCIHLHELTYEGELLGSFGFPGEKRQTPFFLSGVRGQRSNVLNMSRSPTHQQELSIQNAFKHGVGGGKRTTSHIPQDSISGADVL